MVDQYKMERRGDRVHVLVKDFGCAVWFSLGGSGDPRIALRLWLALISRGRDE
ncbi:hypothetical protein [Antarctobacter jejuensis]|uniref:hypothetical protein n=1 Tax=Antarctobacter jejuensis TaxID=1439938 RepID=UPI003FD4090F